LTGMNSFGNWTRGMKGKDEKNKGIDKR